MKLRDVALAILVMMVWGFNFVAGKWGLSEVPPLLLMSMRFALVAALLLPFARMPRRQMRGILVLSVTLGTLHFGLMFGGLARLDAGVASIVVQTQVPFAAIISAVYYRDFFGWRRTLGLVTAVAGVVVLAGTPSIGADFIPAAMVVGAALFWAIANVQIKELGAIDGFALNGYLALFCAPQLLASSLIFEHGQLAALRESDIWLVMSLIYMAVIVTILGFMTWYRLLHRYAINQIVPFMLLVPIFAVVFGIVFLDEALDWRVIVGGSLIVGGVGVITIRRPRLATPEASAQIS